MSVFDVPPPAVAWPLMNLAGGVRKMMLLPGTVQKSHDMLSHFEIVHQCNRRTDSQLPQYYGMHCIALCNHKPRRFRNGWSIACLPVGHRSLLSVACHELQNSRSTADFFALRVGPSAAGFTLEQRTGRGNLHTFCW